MLKKIMLAIDQFKLEIQSKYTNYLTHKWCHKNNAINFYFYLDKY